MKKHFLITLLAFCAPAIFLITNTNVYAADSAIDKFDKSLDTSACEAGLCENYTASTSELIGTIITGLLNFLGVAFLLLIIYGGIMWMTAGGSERKIEQAKKIIINSAIGLAIIFLAQMISFLIIDVLLPGK